MPPGQHEACMNRAVVTPRARRAERSREQMRSTFGPIFCVLVMTIFRIRDILLGKGGQIDNRIGYAVCTPEGHYDTGGRGRV